ncbi:hypothetical protein Plhal703r1_c11g0058751 [Plasmopara halstedii]
MRRTIRTQKLVDSDNEERYFERTFRDFLEKILMTPLAEHEVIEANSIENLVLLSARMPVKDLFDVFDLKKAVGNLLDNLKWKKWAYIVCKVKGGGNHYKAILGAMLEHFNVQELVERLMEAAVATKTNAIAKTLLNELNNREDATKVSAVKVYEWLGLNPVTTNIFETPEHAKWSAYLSACSAEQYAKDPLLTELVGTLEFKTNEGLHKVLADNASNPTSRMQLITLMTVWLAEKVLPSRIIIFLEPDPKECKNLLFDFQKNKPIVKFWMFYSKMFSFKNPNEKVTPMDTFSQVFGLKNAATMIYAAKMVGDESVSPLAASMLLLQFQQWKIERLRASVLKKMFDDDTVLPSMYSSKNKEAAVEFICQEYGEYMKYWDILDDMDDEYLWTADAFNKV